LGTSISLAAQGACDRPSAAVCRGTPCCQLIAWGDWLQPWVLCLTQVLCEVLGLVYQLGCSGHLHQAWCKSLQAQQAITEGVSGCIRYSHLLDPSFESSSSYLPLVGVDGVLWLHTTVLQCSRQPLSQEGTGSKLQDLNLKRLHERPLPGTFLLTGTAMTDVTGMSNTISLTASGTPEHICDGQMLWTSLQVSNSCCCVSSVWIPLTMCLLRGGPSSNSG
jgi:hypothetical protein